VGLARELSEARFLPACDAAVQQGSEQREKFWRMWSWDWSQCDRSKAAAGI